MNTRCRLAITMAALVGLTGLKADAHCQIPCGIYDDAARIAQLREHVVTLEKSMKEIARLEAEEKADWNQIVRWVNNKDQHADEFAEIVTYYFMAQRIKPAPKGDDKASAKYDAELSLLHRMLVHAMKAKQTTALVHIETLRSLIGEFESSYFGKAEQKKAQ